MKALRVLRRLLRLLRMIGRGLVDGNAEHVRALKGTPPDPAAQGKNQAWFRDILGCLNVDVLVTGQWTPGTRLVVSNHISWLDIIVLGSVLPVVFLSKGEIAHWPVVARLARAGGTLFIKRGREGAARHSIETICNEFARGQSVVVFPEGTTGEGREVRLFHPRLFAAAIETGRPVQPVALRYPHSGGVHPKVPYVGRQSLVANMFGLLGCKSIQAEVRIGPEIDPQGLDRRHLAEQAREFVVGVVQPDGAGR